MPRVCIICYKEGVNLMSSNADSPVAQAKGKLFQFLKLIDDGTYRLPSQDLINAGMYACDDCSRHLKDICQLYNQKIMTENLLSRQVCALETTMSRAQADSSKLEKFRMGANCLSLTENTVDEIISFRNELIQNSKRVLTPLLPLPTMTPQTHQNPQIAMEAIKNLNAITTRYSLNNRAGSSSFLTPTNSNNASEQSRTSKTVTTTSQPNNSTSLAANSSEQHSYPKFSLADVNTAVTMATQNVNVTLLKNLFELPGNPNQNLAKKFKSSSENPIKLMNTPTEAGTIPKPESSRREGENVARKDPPGESNHRRLFGKTVHRTLSNRPKSLSPDKLKSKTELRKGKTTSEPPEQQFICDSCAVSFPTYTTLLQHLNLKLCQIGKSNSASVALLKKYLGILQTSVPGSEPPLQPPAGNTEDPSNMGVVEFPNYSEHFRAFYKFVNGRMVFQPEQNNNEYEATGGIGNPDEVTLEDEEWPASPDSDQKDI